MPPFRPDSPRRFRHLPRATLRGVEYPVATTVRARLLGLAMLDRERAGPGLLIPCCASVHSFGMRFALDVRFLDEEGGLVAIHRAVPPRRIVRHLGAAAVLELPAGGRVE